MSDGVLFSASLTPTGPTACTEAEMEGITSSSLAGKNKWTQKQNVTAVVNICLNLSQINTGVTMHGNWDAFKRETVMGTL